MEGSPRHTNSLSCNQWYLIVRMEEIDLSGVPIIPASNHFRNSSIHEYSTTLEENVNPGECDGESKSLNPNTVYPDESSLFQAEK